MTTKEQHHQAHAGTEQNASAPERYTTSDPSTPVRQVRLRPEADIFRDEHQVRLLLDLPGAKDQDVEVEVHDGILSVQARAERGQGDERIYERSFRLDRRMNTQDVRATLEQGVLTVQIPFHEEAKPKRITVQSA